MTKLDQFVQPNADRVAAKVIEGEAILIDMSTGNYFSMAGSAGFLWSLMEQGATLGELVEAVSHRYGVTPELVEADVVALAQNLSGEGLVQLADQGPNGALEVGAPEPGVDLEYAAPSYEKFSDMAEMFALDPPLPGLAKKD